MTITPDQADHWTQTTTTGPWYVHTDPGDPDGTFIYDDNGNMCVAVEPTGSAYLPGDLHLIAAAPELAQTIAGMEWQWSVERLTEDGSRWLIDRPWTCDRELAETWLRKYDGSRLVRRLVGPVVVASGEHLRACREAPEGETT